MIIISIAMRNLSALFRRQPFDSNSSPSKPTIRAKEWAQHFRPTSPQLFHAHLLDFFLAQGHYDLALKFSEQAGVKMPRVKEEEVRKRLQIKEMIRMNEIDEAIQLIHLIQPGLLQTPDNLQLLFSLKCLKVINLITKNNLPEAIQTAKSQLLPLTATKPHLLSLLEQVMSLIAFQEVKECSSYSLTTLQHRGDVAARINEVMIGDRKRDVQGLVGLSKWCQKKLQGVLGFPKIYLIGKQMYET